MDYMNPVYFSDKQFKSYDSAWVRVSIGIPNISSTDLAWAITAALSSLFWKKETATPPGGVELESCVIAYFVCWITDIKSTGRFEKILLTRWRFHQKMSKKLDFSLENLIFNRLFWSDRKKYRWYLRLKTQEYHARKILKINQPHPKP